MKNKTQLFIGVISIAFILFSCAKVGPMGANGYTQRIIFTGAISGHVSLYDQYGSVIQRGYNSIQLSLSGGGIINPDSFGFYLFSNDTTNKYYINASDTGFGSTIKENIFLLRDTLNVDLGLSIIPNFSPTNFTVSSTLDIVNNPKGDSLVLSFASDNRMRNCIVFVNWDSTINGIPANYLLSYIKTIPPAPQGSFTTISFIIPSQDLYNAGFASNNKVFYKAYGYVVNDKSVYEDFTTGKNVYTAISTAAILDSVLVP